MRQATSARHSASFAVMRRPTPRQPAAHPRSEHPRSARRRRRAVLLLAALLLGPAAFAAASAGGADSAAAEPPDPGLAGLGAGGAATAVDGPQGSPPEYRVGLGYTVTDTGLLPVWDLGLSGVIVGVDGTADPADAAFGCTVTDFQPPLPEPGPDGMLWLTAGGSLDCAAAVTLAPGDYDAVLTATADTGNTQPLTPDQGAGAGGECPQDDCWTQQLSASATVPLNLAPPPSPSPSPPPPPPSAHPAAQPSSPPPSPAAVALPPSPSPSASPSPSPSPSLSPSPTPVLLPAAAQAPPTTLPLQPQIPTPLFVLIMVLPAAAGGAAIVGSRR